MRARLPVLILVLPLLVAATPREAPSKDESDFWGNIAEPGRKQFLAALKRGRAIFEAAERGSPHLRARHFEDALAAFLAATRSCPTEALGHFWLGKTYYQLERMKDAIGAFKQVRKLKPDFSDDYSMAFKLGIAYSKLGKFEEAVTEYSRAERILAARGQGSTDATFGRSLLHANAAESLMAIGRLDEAIQRYEDSVALYPGYKLAWWGLAVAYDRDEQISKAQEALQKAMSGDSTMSALTAKDVFFVPGGDIHYYFALGHESRGDGPAARKAWQQFLGELPKSPWAFRARDHLAALGEGPRTTPGKGKRLAPTPNAKAFESDGGGVQDQLSMRYRFQGYLYRVRQCYQKELKNHPKLAGQLRVTFVVTREGKVKDPKIVGSTVKRASLHSCILDVVKGAYFNRPSSGDVKVVYPLEFKPQSGP
jgi:tetratricopeptide (TPR) repeat protein